VLLCVGVRYKGLSIIKKSSCNYPVRKSGKFQSSGIIGNMLMLGISISFGLSYLRAWAIVHCLMIGIPEPPYDNFQ
jgi:hypothetical protein